MIFNRDYEEDIARDTIEAWEEEGYTGEEIIPGLILAVVMLAGGDETYLDAAANLLADAGSEDVHGE